MEKTLGYIFGSLQLSEAAIAGIIRDLKTQNKINRYFALMAMAGGLYILSSERKMNNLVREIEELKKLKGE